MADRLTLKAYAKINLSLEITGRRADGYHLLRSVMQSISLYDLLTVERAKGLFFACNDSALPGEQNTVMKAARAFFARAAVPENARLTLDKRLPYQAGLGSASADAAAALVGLNALYGAPLDGNTLLEVGASVGADVPFCMTGGCMLAEGIGERLTTAPPLPDCAVVIAKPHEGLSTAEAYARIDARPILPPGDIERLLSALQRGGLSEIGAACRNVFETVCTVGEVFEIKRVLTEEGALGAAMSGSGSAVFGLFCSDEAARRAAGRLRTQFGYCEVAHPVNCGVSIL